MQKKRKKFFLTITLFLLAILCSILFPKKGYAGELYESPYVTMSPDGKAFTTNAMDQAVEWYDYGTVVETGVSSLLREPEVGEHYYQTVKTGKLPVGSWKVAYKTSSCCHNAYPPVQEPYHGITYGRKNCKTLYYSGWIAYCADCKEALQPFFFYMSKEAAATIKVLETGLDYYYLCPFCTNLEQGVNVSEHWCREISWNRYQVRYDSNSTDWVGGYMENSFHMYNNATRFEGREVTPVEQLSKNTYVRIGYEFAGWNTEPDGSGRGFTDQEKIYNLTGENYDELGAGVVRLYAQWKKSSGILRIDPAGGSYRGTTGIVEVPGEYGSVYLLQPLNLTPPKGAKVIFQTNGGKNIAPIVGDMSFCEWIMEEPFSGNLKDNLYSYTVMNGNVDTVVAKYDREPVVLPATQKEGYSFGGWYFDQKCTLPAGGAGDSIVLQQDVTLYAKWVDLVLEAKNNDSANGGKGAVDLSWKQSDGQSKTYMIYQSADNINWTLVSDAEDIGNSNGVKRSFSYTGKEQRFVVPYTGLYLLTANGAQGKDYGGYSGGYGGRVTGKVWLEKGEELIYSIGGQNGYNGGGGAASFGNGGGSTIVSSNRKGMLFVAGGGGGATMIADGGPGGSSVSNLSGGQNGEFGSAGGGGGYQGGTAGEVVYHHHSESCYTTQDTSYTVMSYPNILSSWAQSYSQLAYCYYAYGAFYGEGKTIWDMGAHGRDNAVAGIDVSIGEYLDSAGRRVQAYIPTEENTTLQIHMLADTSGGHGMIRDGSLIVYDQNEQVIFYKTLNQVTKYTEVNGYNQASIDYFLDQFERNTGGRKGFRSGWYGFYQGTNGTDLSMVYWNETVSLPKGTTGVRIRLISEVGENETWFGASIQEIRFSGSKRIKLCAYEEGELILAKPAYGGSNYVNVQHAIDYTKDMGMQMGNGSFSIESIKIGYQEELYLKGVKAQDYAAPGRIDKEKVHKNATGESSLFLSWQEPQDQGCDYYHKAESYLVGSTEVLSQSNVTKNTLISGVAGYYYLINELPETIVNSGNGRLIKETGVQIDLTASKQYFHVAAVDRAGNIGDTVHLEIGKEDEEVNWPIVTDKLQIRSLNGSVYQAGEDTYFVKSDGKTPFWLNFTGRILGQATVAYQVNHLIYHMQVDNSEGVTLDVYTPSAEEITGNMIVTNASQVTKILSGKAELKDDLYTITKRSNQCKQLSIEQRFTMEVSGNGKKIKVVPVAGADFGEETVFSDWEKDTNNGLWLIGDCVAPTISGVESLETFDEKEMVNGRRTFTFLATDEGCGVKEFYAIITNNENAGRREFRASGQELEIVAEAADELFQGEFVVEFFAVDYVGNERILSCVGENFALTAYVERLLSPHEPVFRCGESGCINITVYGCPEKVEVIFPEALSVLDARINSTFLYEGKESRVEEKYVFMIPLKAPCGEFSITVKAWKGSEVIIKEPVIRILGEDVSILHDIRTRLR